MRLNKGLNKKPKKKKNNHLSITPKLQNAIIRILRKKVK